MYTVYNKKRQNNIYLQNEHTFSNFHRVYPGSVRSITYIIDNILRIRYHRYSMDEFFSFGEFESRRTLSSLHLFVTIRL